MRPDFSPNSGPPSARPGGCNVFRLLLASRDTPSGVGDMQDCVRVGLVLALLPAACGRGAAAEVYVAPAGSDDNPGTLEKPFATIQRAQAAVGPGHTVFVRGGTYPM